jgi:hypothetical protein
MPLPDQYRRQLTETQAAAEREARWDGLREWLRAVGEIVLSTVLGMGLTFLAFLTGDETLGRIYWLVGCIVWIGGVAKAVLGAYRRGLDEGRW